MSTEIHILHSMKDCIVQFLQYLSMHVWPKCPFPKESSIVMHVTCTIPTISSPTQTIHILAKHLFPCKTHVKNNLFSVDKNSQTNCNPQPWVVANRIGIPKIEVPLNPLQTKSWLLLLSMLQALQQAQLLFLHHLPLDAQSLPQPPHCSHHAPVIQQHTVFVGQTKYYQPNYVEETKTVII